jgi:hypothetical protein
MTEDHEQGFQAREDRHAEPREGIHGPLSWTVRVNTMLRCDAAICALVHRLRTHDAFKLPAVNVPWESAMKLMQDTNAPGAQGTWLEGGVVALAQRTIGRMGLALAGATRAARGAGMAPGCARRTDPPPFADTEAGWHHL